MANSGPNSNGSQFFITLAPTQWLDGKSSIIFALILACDLIDRALRSLPDSIAATTWFGTPSVMYANDGCMTPDCSRHGTG